MGGSKSSRPRAKRTERAAGARTEWVGGRVTAPFDVLEEAEPAFHPELILWLELPQQTILSMTAVHPRDAAGAVARALREAIEQPMSGPARRPRRVRVADAGLAEEVGEVLGDRVPVTVGPTPEVDVIAGRFVEAHAEQVAFEAEGLFSWWRELPADPVAELVGAADALYRLAPWEHAADDLVLGVDVPELGVESACLVVIGALRESAGFLLFPSRAGLRSFLRTAVPSPDDPIPMDAGGDWLSLTYDGLGEIGEIGDTLARTLHREVAGLGWTLGPSSLPVLRGLTRTGEPRALGERELAVATACARGLAAFVREHGEALAQDRLVAVRESYPAGGGVEVVLSYRSDALRLVTAPGPARDFGGPEPLSFIGVGRNDPCPCGSGRKFKKCHLARQRAEEARERENESVHQRDQRLVESMMRWAMRRFGRELARFEDSFDDPEQAAGLSVPWAVYGHPLDGRPVVEHYLEERGSAHTEEERRWLEAQCRSWLSVWEVVAVESGVSLGLRDLLTGETAEVEERQGSESLVQRDAILARVVKDGERSVLCGVHPHRLPPSAAAEVVRRAKGKLRRKKPVLPERLRDGEMGAYLIRRWEGAVRGLVERPARPARLHNTDDEPLLVTYDHFTVEQGAEAAVEERLARLPGFEIDGPLAGEREPTYVFLRENPKGAMLPNVVIGRARLGRGSLVLETNSRERADALRRKVEAACGALVRHRIRGHADPLSRALPNAADPPPPGQAPAEEAQLVLEVKEQLYRNWPDQPLPALAGMTPRRAVRTAAGREAVDLLLREMENREQRAGGAAYDFASVRRQLRLE